MKRHEDESSVRSDTHIVRVMGLDLSRWSVGEGVIIYIQTLLVPVN